MNEQDGNNKMVTDEEDKLEILCKKCGRAYQLFKKCGSKGS
jgi:hypothetical protein